MASIFELAIETGPAEAASLAVAQHFENFQVELGSNKYLSVCRTAQWTDSDKNCWCSIIPSGASRTGGIGDVITSKQDLFELASSLYNRLRSAPSFRYAVCGFDVTPFDSYSRLIAAKGCLHQYFNGLVLANWLWAELGKPSGYEVFSSSARWTPLRRQDVMP